MRSTDTTWERQINGHLNTYGSMLQLLQNIQLLTTVKRLMMHLAIIGYNSFLQTTLNWFSFMYQLGLYRHHL